MPHGEAFRIACVTFLLIMRKHHMNPTEEKFMKQLTCTIQHHNYCENERKALKPFHRNGMTGDRKSQAMKNPISYLPWSLATKNIIDITRKISTDFWLEIYIESILGL